MRKKLGEAHRITGGAIFRTCKYFWWLLTPSTGLGLPISQWGYCWIQWSRRSLLTRVFPVSVVMQGSGGWTFHELWKVQAVIMWNWGEVCVEGGRSERAATILRERVPLAVLKEC